MQQRVKDLESYLIARHRKSYFFYFLEGVNYKKKSSKKYTLLENGQFSSGKSNLTGGIA